VTGGASGIGAAVAERLSAEGATVLVVDRDAVGLATMADRIRSAGGRVSSVVADVADLDAMLDVARHIGDEHGRCDILVTSAGIQRYGDVVGTTMQTWDEVIRVNLTGVFVAAKAILPLLRVSSRGAVVVVSSVQGDACQTGVAAYAASKGALGALARAMALDEAGYGVRVNTVSPGSVDTPMLRRSARLFTASDQDPALLLRRWGSAHPLGRLAHPDEIAAVVSFLSSPEASFVTGENVRVDGGLLAGIAVNLPAESPS
jgi:NAD(P)-dependent dehydrogenase (short-subunit alcohol dehydrogenase family)